MASHPPLEADPLDVIRQMKDRLGTEATERSVAEAAAYAALKERDEVREELEVLKASVARALRDIDEEMDVTGPLRESLISLGNAAGIALPAFSTADPGEA